MTARAPISLIINADDYGYFPCVSQGIREAAQANALTATGILANSADLATQLLALEALPELDLGVHLNLTFQRPLTAAMAEKLAAWQGHFPNAYVMSGLILRGKISIELVRQEWQAQIEACGSKKLYFLNSHEHIHMLPALFKLTVELAQVYEITHIRLTKADWRAPFGLSAAVRNTVISALQAANKSRSKKLSPILLGLSASGKLTYPYLATLFSRLQPGHCYELMCHPGRFDPSQITEPRLRAYHDWEGELALLQSPPVRALYEKFSIRLSPYRDLSL